MQLTQEEEEMIPNGKEMNWNGHRLVFESEVDVCEGCFFADKDECPDCDEGIWVEDNPSPWHTGTPTEEGDYFVAYHWGLDNKIMHDMASRILYGATTFENGNWKIDYPYVVVAWQKIEPCYPTQEMVKGE